MKPAERLNGAPAVGSASTDLIAEAGQKWVQNWGDDAVPSMVAATSIMRVQQILMARLNDILGPFELTFPRYEALMLLYLVESRLAAARQDRRAAAGAPHERDQPRRRARALGLRRAEAARSDRRMMLAVITAAGRAVAEEATEALNEVRFATEPLTDRDLDSITDILRKLRADADGFPLTA